MQKFIQTYIIFKERVILQIVKLFFHNNLTDSIFSIPQNTLLIKKEEFSLANNLISLANLEQTSSKKSSFIFKLL